MERQAFEQFAALEAGHWWFIGRRRLYLSLLAGVLRRDRPALAPSRALSAPSRLSRLVDVGCGVGGFLEPMSALGPVLGLELDEPSIAFCRQRGFRRTAVARSDALPLPAASQELLCLWDVLEHTPDDRVVLAELYRCLRPGGHLAISVPAYQFLYANNDRVAHHMRRYTRRQLASRLREAGFEVRKATYVNVLLGVLIIPAVLLIKLKERLFPIANDDTTNLSWRLPRPLNALLAAIFSGERHLLAHLDAPFGHSLFAVARRPPA